MDSEQVKLDSADYEVVPLNDDSSWKKDFKSILTEILLGNMLLLIKPK